MSYRGKLAAAADDPILAVPCHHAGCQINASQRVPNGAGWINLCKPHADRLHAQEVKRWLSQHGLETKEQKRGFRESVAKKVQPNKQWAEDIISRYAKGEAVSSYSYRLACEATAAKEIAVEVEEF